MRNRIIQLSVKKKVIKIFLILLTLILSSMYCYAHSGNTDANGGHYDRSTGVYHYHHGHPAHQHSNGVCPYETPTNDISGNNSYTSISTGNTVRQTNVEQPPDKNSDYSIGVLAAVGVGGYFVREK